MMTPERRKIMNNNFNEDQEFNNEPYDPEKHGYYPDKIYEAPKGYRPPKKQPKIRLDEFERGNKEKIRSAGNLILTVISLSCGSLSLALSVTSLFFAFSGAIGLVINIISFVLAWAAVGTAVAGWGANNTFIGIPRGRLEVTALVLAVIAFLVSGVFLAFTGCGAIFSCTFF